MMRARSHGAVTAPQTRSELAGAAGVRGPGFPARRERDPVRTVTSHVVRWIRLRFDGCRPLQ
jgi:hypothetical protein